MLCAEYYITIHSYPLTTDKIHKMEVIKVIMMRKNSSFLHVFQNNNYKDYEYLFQVLWLVTSTFREVLIKKHLSFSQLKYQQIDTNTYEK